MAPPSAPRRTLQCLAAVCVLSAARGAPVNAEAFASELRLEGRTWNYDVYETSFPSAMRGLFRSNDTVWGHLYVPRGKKGDGPPPAVLILPVMAAPNAWIEERFVQSLLRRRIAAYWIEMPYQFRRRPHPSVPSGQSFLARSPRALARNFLHARADAARALTWLRNSGRVDADRIGLFGVSLGALVGSSLYAFDDEAAGALHAAVFALGGADFPDLVMRGSMTSAFARRSGFGEKELREAWTGMDPLERPRAGGRVLLINAAADGVVPPENADKLAAALPGARRMRVPWGHYGAILHLLWIPDRVAREFARMSER